MKLRLGMKKEDKYLDAFKDTAVLFAELGGYGREFETNGFPKGTSFNDKTGMSGTVYYYRVRACEGPLCSKFSAANTGYRGTIPSAQSDHISNLNPDVPIPAL